MQWLLEKTSESERLSERPEEEPLGTVLYFTSLVLHYTVLPLYDHHLRKICIKV